MAEATKIRVDHLEALEKGDYDPFPAPVYIRGSVRTYASFLRLDPATVLSTLDAELADSPEFSEPPSLSGARRGPLDWLTYQLSRVNWRLTGIALAVLLVVASALIGWKMWTQRMREDPLSRLGPGLYRPAPASEGDLLPLPPGAPAPAPASASGQRR